MIYMTKYDFNTLHPVLNISVGLMAIWRGRKSWFKGHLLQGTVKTENCTELVPVLAIENKISIRYWIAFAFIWYEQGKPFFNHRLLFFDFQSCCFCNFVFLFGFIFPFLKIRWLNVIRLKTGSSERGHYWVTWEWENR